jgi:hypothetical protein
MIFVILFTFFRISWMFAYAKVGHCLVRGGLSRAVTITITITNRALNHTPQGLQPARTLLFALGEAMIIAMASNICHSAFQSYPVI